MIEDTDRDLGRRRFLKAVGAAGVAGAVGTARAGDGGEGGGGDGDYSTRRFEGSIAAGERDVRTYEVRAGDAGAVRVRLSAGCDADLYVTLDGRKPTPSDFDRASRGEEGYESVTLEGDVLAGTGRLGVLVAGYAGEGDYELSVTECERGRALPEGGDSPVRIADPRLVQVVEDTRMVNEAGETAATAPDPDLVGGRYTAPVFDLAGTARDLDTDLAVTVTREWAGGSETHSFALPRGMARRVVRGDAETRAALHRLERGLAGPEETPPVFRIDPDSRRVEVALSTPAGRPLDRTTLERGRDYRVREVPPLTLGFVPVEDPTGGDDYGDFDGQCMAYERTVACAVGYVRRVYPGGVVAYRHDRYLEGTDEARTDSVRADDELEAARTDGSFPRKGTLYAPGRDRATALDRIGDGGFDATVMIVPGNELINVGANDYLAHHFPEKGYDFGVGWHDPEMAVAVLESGGLGNLDVIAAITVAHELGHRFVADPYEGPAPDHPFAQRDGADRLGTDATVDGQPVDFDHARGPKLGDPHVVSTAYDLTDGTFSLVNGFGVGHDFTSHGPRTNLFNLDATPLPSFMSYQWKKKWADSIVYQGILDALARD